MIGASRVEACCARRRKLQSDKDVKPIASDGIRLLEKYKDQRFFIGIGFHRPHATPTAPRRFYDLYDPAAMTLPSDFAPRPTLPAGIPAVALPAANDTYMNGDTSPETAREVIRAYRASASWTDWNMGRVLDALERLGLADTTIVVFASDHGYHNGEKGRHGARPPFSWLAQRAAHHSCSPRSRQRQSVAAPGTADRSLSNALPTVRAAASQRLAATSR